MEALTRESFFAKNDREPQEFPSPYWGGVARFLSPNSHDRAWARKNGFQVSEETGKLELSPERLEVAFIVRCSIDPSFNQTSEEIDVIMETKSGAEIRRYAKAILGDTPNPLP